MSTFGLHYSLFYIEKNLSIEEFDIAHANLQDILTHAKKHNAKFLYNEMLDYQDLDNHINLLSKYEKDAAYVSMIVDRPIEIFDYIYENTTINQLLIDPIIDHYLMATYRELVENYFHNLIFSNKLGDIQLGGYEYKMFIDFEESNFLISLLPLVSDMDDFENYFSLYQWFYSRRNRYEVLLIDSFMQSINRADNMDNILTSLLRGVYYPIYNTNHGADKSIYDIEAHRDNNQKVRIKENGTGKFTDTILYRVYVLAYNKVKEGKIRIGYVIYQETYIIFCYHNDHCDKMTGFKNKEFTLNSIPHNLSIVKS